MTLQHVFLKKKRWSTNLQPSRQYICLRSCTHISWCMNCSYGHMLSNTSTSPRVLFAQNGASMISRDSHALLESDEDNIERLHIWWNKYVGNLLRKIRQRSMKNGLRSMKLTTVTPLLAVPRLLS